MALSKVWNFRTCGAWSPRRPAKAGEGVRSSTALTRISATGMPRSRSPANSALACASPTGSAWATRWKAVRVGSFTSAQKRSSSATSWSSGVSPGGASFFFAAGFSPRTRAMARRSAVAVSKSRSVGPVPAMSTTTRSSLPGAISATTARSPKSGSRPGTTPATSLPRSFVAEEQALGRRGGQGSADGVHLGVCTLASSNSIAESPASPLPCTSRVGFPASLFRQTSERPRVTSEVTEEDVVLGGCVGEAQREGRGQGRLACASLASEQVQYRCVTHGVLFGPSEKECPLRPVM